jgi:hypothetical protein
MENILVACLFAGAIHWQGNGFAICQRILPSCC